MKRTDDIVRIVERVVLEVIMIIATALMEYQ